MDNDTRLEKFRERLKLLLDEKFPEVWANLSKAVPTTFRVNTLKAKPSEALDELRNEGINFKPGPLSNSYVVISQSPKLSETRAFNDGKIYIQELSSMLPAIELAPKPGEKILDLCASPGSKTSQIAALANNQADIVAVEKSRDRFFRLKSNLEQLGVMNVQLLMEDGTAILYKHPEFLNFFDKVLVDAPCSNEAAIDPKRPETYKFWNSKKSEQLSNVQRRLLINGINMLKPGGILVYSTCTFSIEENEKVVDWAARKSTGLKSLTKTLRFENMVTVQEKWNGKDLSNVLKDAYRVLPNGLSTGFFVAKMTK